MEGVWGMKGRREDGVRDDAGAEERMLKRPEESKTETCVCLLVYYTYTHIHSRSIIKDSLHKVTFCF